MLQTARSKRKRSGPLYVILYSQTSIERPSIKRSPSIEQPLSKVLNSLSVKCRIRYLCSTATSISCCCCCFFTSIKVTVDLQGCLPKSHSHARRLCYNVRSFRQRPVRQRLRSIRQRPKSPCQRPTGQFANVRYLVLTEKKLLTDVSFGEN